MITKQIIKVSKYEKLYSLFFSDDQIIFTPDTEINPKEGDTVEYNEPLTKVSINGKIVYNDTQSTNHL